MSDAGACSDAEEIMLSSKEQVKRLFSERVSEWAACYADAESRSLAAQNLASRQRIALEMVEEAVRPASRVLDLGCGTGEMAAALMCRGYEVWGLDIAEPMIHYARQRCGSDRFWVGDIEHLPFRDSTFDAVVCLGVIEYLDMDERTLHEMWRVLKPGGRAVVSTPSAISPVYHVVRMLVGLRDAARRVQNLVSRQRGRSNPVHPASRKVRSRRYYRRTWLRFLRSVALEPESWVCHTWGWYGEWLGRPLTQRLSRRWARNRALNWLLAEQLVRVRAVKASVASRVREGQAARGATSE
jgi:ubiquinone/menaquinone biosynthesis C-methylase UbiE